MDRRQILKGIVGIGSVLTVPVMLKGKEVAKILEIDKNSKYIVLIKASSGIDVETFCNDPNVGLPIGTPVYVVDDPETDIKILKL